MVESNLKIPLPTELPKPEDREFINTIQPKPVHAVVDVKFGELTPRNFEQLRIINYVTLPVIYSE